MKVQCVRSLLQPVEQGIVSIIDRGREYACRNISQIGSHARGVEDICFWQRNLEYLRAQALNVLNRLAVEAGREVGDPVDNSGRRRS